MSLAKQLQYLESIDVGSTNITGESLRELVTSCLNLRQVNITGCKKLNNSDDLVLRNNNINFDAGEDVFRFHLMPDYNSDMPKITHSVLKTRSTLSLHKVYRYLIKKLQEANVAEYIEEDASVEETIVILCNGAVLATSLQLKHVKNLHWPFEDRLLTLNYRRKDTIQASQTLPLRGLYRSNSMLPRTSLTQMRPSQGRGAMNRYASIRNSCGSNSSKVA